MNYYEELGIRHDASVEEIHQAYRMMARLLHPDGRLDPRLKALAECQMKRLGEILATLVNPQKRRQYDDSLSIGYRLPVRVAWTVPPAVREPGWDLTRFAAGYWFWVVMGVSVVMLGAWNLADRGVPGRVSAARAPGGNTVDIGQGQPAQPRRESGAHSSKPRPAIPHLASRLAPDTPPESLSTREPMPDPDGRESDRQDAALAEPVIPPAAPLSPAVALTRQDGLIPSPGSREPAATKDAAFAGRWLYSPGGPPAGPGQYPATYVEFSLLEENGILTGEYRARYRISDRAVSSDVSFQVHGAPAPAEGSTTLDWVSRIGSKGKVELTLRRSDSLHVVWWTTEFGKGPATLGSGTADLIRQRAP